MITRYSRPEMAKNWSSQNKFQTMLEVELAVAEAQAHLGIIPQNAAQSIKSKARFQIERIEEIEKTTKHDVIAFVSCVAESIGEDGRYLHYGMTSSDVLDTALSLQIQRAGDILDRSIAHLLSALLILVEKYRGQICAGRTHGIHAEPTTFGFKMAGFFAEFSRHRQRLLQALKGCATGKLSGAVGTYSAQPMEVEASVCQKLGLIPETIATQVVPRDRHAEVFFSLAMVGGGLERLAIELRHLQRTEVGEVIEGFSSGQKGSSAMPHKKNPISAENISGAVRLLRGYLLASLENIALWHERDISHSSVERVAFPDAFILTDYAVDRMTFLLKHLTVDGEKMQTNMELSSGHLFSSHVLLALVDSGMSREEAYRAIQIHAHSLKSGESLYKKLLDDSEILNRLGREKLEQIFSGETHRLAIEKVVSRFLDSQASAHSV